MPFPSYTSLYRTSHALVLARNPKVAGSNPAHATNEIKGLGEKLNLFLLGCRKGVAKRAQRSSPCRLVIHHRRLRPSPTRTAKGSVARCPLGRLWRMISPCDDAGRRPGGETMLSCKGAPFPQAIMLMSVRW
jgi:hypothetical protein